MSVLYKRESRFRKEIAHGDQRVKTYMVVRLSYSAADYGCDRVIRSMNAIRVIKVKATREIKDIIPE